MLTQFFFGPFLIWLPLVFSSLVLLVIVLNFVFKEKKGLKFIQKLTTQKLIFIVVFGTLFFDLFLSGLQFFVWRTSPFSHFFLPPYTPISYFFRYIFIHLWAADIIAFICGVIIFLLFKLARKYRENIVSAEELLLILLISLLIGWPKFILMIPLFLFLTLILSLVNMVAFKKQDTNLELPMIISSIIILILGSYILNILALSNLAI